MPFVPAYEGQFPSLGPQVIEHVEHYLGLELLREQAERLVRLYRLDDRGRRVVRRAALRRPKGAGKSPEAGYIGFAELTGPAVFAGWDERGQPVGRPRDSERYDEPFPWIQFAALSEDQTDNVTVWLYEVLRSRGDTVVELGIDLGRTRIYLVNRPGRIEPVTAAAGSREGQPITYAGLDQTEAWKVENSGVRLARVLRRNVAKTQGWTYELQNAPEPGDGSVADETSKAWEKGQAGLLFDTREPSKLPDLAEMKRRLAEGAPDPEDRPALIAALAEAYGESASRGFVSLERQAAEVLDLDTTVSDGYRFYLNVPWAAPETLIDERSWDALKGATAPDPGTEVTAGFSGLIVGGAALVGCVLESGDLFVLETWDTGTELVPRVGVQAAVERLMDRYTVRRLYVDPHVWQTEYDSWHLAWGDTVVARPPQQTARTAVATDRFRTAVVGRAFRHDGNPVVRRQLLRARTRMVPAGTLIVPKTDAPADQITAAKAAVLAWEARADVLAATPPAAPTVHEWPDEDELQEMVATLDE